jgi:hypothetical protein
MVYVKGDGFRRVEDEAGNVLVSFRIMRLEATGQLFAYGLAGTGDAGALRFCLRSLYEEDFGEPVYADVDPTKERWAALIRLYFKFGWKAKAIVLELEKCH